MPKSDIPFSLAQRSAGFRIALALALVALIWVAILALLR